VCQNRRVRRIAEIVGTLAMATDLGLGLPIEHAIRACLMSLEMGRRLAVAPAELMTCTISRFCVCWVYQRLLG
jgi:hypothetical protein